VKLCAGERSEQQENISTIDFERGVGVRTAGNEEGIKGRRVAEGRAGEQEQ
jgi:hypothetical protein